MPKNGGEGQRFLRLGVRMANATSHNPDQQFIVSQIIQLYLFERELTIRFMNHSGCGFHHLAQVSISNNVSEYQACYSQNGQQNRS
jgi:hypothetical protein